MKMVPNTFFAMRDLDLCCEICEFAGEFLAFLTGANLIIDYVLSNAAVARSFTAYLSTALGLFSHSQLRFTINGLPKGYNEMDIIAVAVVLLLTLVICYRYIILHHFFFHFTKIF